MTLIYPNPKVLIRYTISRCIYLIHRDFYEYLKYYFNFDFERNVKVSYLIGTAKKYVQKWSSEGVHKREMPFQQKKTGDVH